MTFVSESGESIEGIDIDCEWQPDSNPTDSVKEVVIRFTAQGTEPAVYNNQEGKILTIRGLWIQAPDKGYTPVFTGNFVLDVGGHFERRTLAVDCGGAGYVDMPRLGYTSGLGRRGRATPPGWPPAHGPPTPARAGRGRPQPAHIL